MNPMDHLPLAPRDLLVLAVLAEAPLHGYGLIKAVEARSEAGVLLDPANLYRVLRRMRRLGWIREASPVEGKPPSAAQDTPGGSEAGSGESRGRSGSGSRRRTYRITPVGNSILAAELRRLERLLRQARPAMVDGGEGR